MVPRFIAAATTAAVLAAFVPAAPAAAQARAMRPALAGKLTTCRVPGLDEDVLCGRRRVDENRAASNGRIIALNIVVVPATTDSVADDPLVFLAGGGVVPATRYARFLATSMPALRRHRDIVLVDQRGTGASNPLACDRARLDIMTALPPDARYLAYIAACRASLAERADVRFYTTSAAMEDLDDVRAWLGYSRVNLYSASYGTSAAATYIRRYPSRVRSVVMHGVVPLDAPMQVDLARSAQESLDRVLELCAADSRCNATYPELHADLARIFARFDSIAAGAGPGQRRNIGQPFRDALNTALSTVAGIRSVPRLIHDAARGTPPPDGGPPPGPEPAPLGVRLALLCSEGLAGIDTSTISRATSRTFLGEFPVRFQLRWCDGWPTAPLPLGFRAPLRSSVPALLLTGELDPITPPRYAEHIREWFSNGVALRLPYRSHSDTDPCVTGIIEAFIVTGGNAPDSSCLAVTPAIDFLEPSGKGG
jgi:pimeloyl-ACP methyl ester carboxylesterase